MVLAVDELRAQHELGNRQVVDRPNSQRAYRWSAGVKARLSSTILPADGRRAN